MRRGKREFHFLKMLLKVPLKSQMIREKYEIFSDKLQRKSIKTVKSDC
jgi:hypothetical protein